jgi:hypothetical protein
VVVTTDDVGDLHECVVDGDYVVVDRDARGEPSHRADENWVADRIGGELDRAADQVVETEGVVFNFESNRKRLAVGEVLPDCGLIQRAAPAGIDLRAMSFGGESSGVQKQR